VHIKNGVLIMNQKSSKIVYTLTDEAPALATASLLPILQRFLKSSQIEIQLKDISLAGRILANFPENLSPSQRIADELKELGDLAKTPDANIIKLPNISASVPQLKAAITELQNQGYKIPDYPENPQNEAEKQIKAKFAKVLGSAVNPILREGNSDRRVATAVKQYAKKHPHSMGAWKKESKTHVANMTTGDFYSTEKAYVAKANEKVSIVFKKVDGSSEVLKDKITLLPAELIDCSVLNVKSLREFYAKEIKDAKEKGVLFSLHLKATMMKVSDPVMFGHAVEVFFESVFKRYEDVFKKIGVDTRNGLGDVYAKIQKLEPELKTEIEKSLRLAMEEQPEIAMVDSDKGITNLHVPSDVIIDASMPAAIRSSGQMWGRDGKLKDTKALVPDRCYSGIYQEVIDFCKAHGAFDVKTMGNVANVGLMAQKAQEYGSHDKTFVLEDSGVVQVLNESGQVVMEQKVDKGDIFRMCQTKEESIKDWVKLAVHRAKATNTPAIFWLDPQRAHDRELSKMVEYYLKSYDLKNLHIELMSPTKAMRWTLEKVKAGKDVISVTGNVLRDYLTDLFPILELGTSAKMLSIVPLLQGGGLYETGAGGSAPKHVQQFLEEGHLRWDSLGEFLAIGVSLEDLALKSKNPRIAVLAKTLDHANGKILDFDKSPQRNVGELDTRGSHFYLAMYWAQALAEQNENQELKNEFSKMAQELTTNESKIVEDLSKAQGPQQDIGGYYHPDPAKTSNALRPSVTFNRILESF
jgi:isocitrate dehydrogenase